MSIGFCSLDFDEIQLYFCEISFTELEIERKTMNIKI